MTKPLFAKEIKCECSQVTDYYMLHLHLNSLMDVIPRNQWAIILSKLPKLTRKYLVGMLTPDGTITHKMIKKADEIKNNCVETSLLPN